MKISRITFFSTDKSVHVKRGPLAHRRYHASRASYNRLVRALDNLNKRGDVAIFRNPESKPPGWQAYPEYY